ncbi:hypothetical protein HDU83_002038 [Entophlyctis luteolus]|nr:hypothetical protein HDU83_002038 [Entophlyctis luteolus]
MAAPSQKLQYLTMGRLFVVIGAKTERSCSPAADKTGKVMDITTGQTSQIAAHDAPISCARFIDGISGAGTMVVTGSWDKTLRV